VDYFNDIVSFKRKPKYNFAKGEGWYRKFYNHARENDKKGEISNYYGIDPAAALRLKQHNPDIKILFCMRNPVDRIWSHYRFAMYFEGKEKREIMQALKEENQYIRISSYHQTLSLYLNHFPKEQIFLIWFEEIYLNPEKLMQDIFSFLGVDPSFRPKSMYKKSNPARKSHYAPLQLMIRKFNNMLVSIGLSGVIKSLKMAGLGNFVMNVTSKPLVKKSIPEEAKKYIIDHIKDDVHQLEKLTGKDLSSWLGNSPPSPLL